MPYERRGLPGTDNPMNRPAKTIFLLLTLLLSLSPGVQGQERDQRKLAEQAVSYGFVSPSTREDLKLEEAVRNLNSADEVRLLHETRELACRVRARPRINKSLGNWADGAENSMVFRIYSDEPTVRYAVASLGKNWRQKSVLYFRRQASGNARLYVISVPRHDRGLNLVVLEVSKILDDSQVSYRTLVTLKTRVMVYVVDLSNELQPKVRNAARQLHARPLTFAGTGGFIGNDNDRDQAQEVFAQEIKSYEANHSFNRRCRQVKPRTHNSVTNKRRTKRGQATLSERSLETMR